MHSIGEFGECLHMSSRVLQRWQLSDLVGLCSELACIGNLAEALYMCPIPWAQHNDILTLETLDVLEL